MSSPYVDVPKRDEIKKDKPFSYLTWIIQGKSPELLPSNLKHLAENNLIKSTDKKEENLEKIEETKDDLKEEKWPEPHHLTGHDAIAKLTGGKESEESFMSTNEPYDIDKLSIETPIPSKVLDADASQYSAVIDVMSEKNSVIQGPPGTGKSQTIANIIAAAVESGKSVLFVAEKIPALQVVANRLKEANLGPLLFELYKGKNIEIIESARTSVEAREEIQQNYNENDLTRVKEEISVRIEKIKDYKELIYETEIFDDLKANQLLWKFLDLKDELGMDLDFRIEFENPPDSFKKKGGKGPLPRAVVRVVTAGTLNEESILAPDLNNFLLAIGMIGNAAKRVEKY